MTVHLAREITAALPQKVRAIDFVSPLDAATCAISSQQRIELWQAGRILSLGDVRASTQQLLDNLEVREFGLVNRCPHGAAKDRPTVRIPDFQGGAMTEEKSHRGELTAIRRPMKRIQSRSIATHRSNTAREQLLGDIDSTQETSARQRLRELLRMTLESTLFMPAKNSGRFGCRPCEHGLEQGEVAPTKSTESSFETCLTFRSRRFHGVQREASPPCDHGGQWILSRTPRLAASPPCGLKLRAHSEPGVAMTEHAVVIAGGGPTGLMLAGELALAGIDVAIVERRASQALVGSRAGGLHARTIEILDQRGIADRFVSQGQTYPVAGFAMIQLDISDFPTRRNYVLGLTQNHIERILAEWVGELAVPIHREREVTGFTQDDAGVDVALSDGQSLRAEYLVGCDGGRSVIRKSAGIDFPGWDPTMSWLIAEVETAEEPAWGFRTDALGSHAIGRREPGGPVGIVLTEKHVAASASRTHAA